MFLRAQHLIFDSEEDSSDNDNDDNNEKVTLTEERAPKRLRNRDGKSKDVKEIKELGNVRANGRGMPADQDQKAVKMKSLKMREGRGKKEGRGRQIWPTSLGENYP